MNLIVSTRTESRHIRFEVDGRWQYGDALQLAYLVKAAQVRAGLGRFLIDLRRVTSDPSSDERFMICDRLLRVFQPPDRFALVGDATLVDGAVAARVAPDAARIALFVREREALAWLLEGTQTDPGDAAAPPIKSAPAAAPFAGQEGKSPPAAGAAGGQEGR